MAKKPLDYNYAKDQEFAKATGISIMEMYHLLKKEREEREARWQENYRAWSVDVNGVDKNYDGMADLCFPQLRKEVETMSRRIFKALFPDDYLKADANRFENEELARVNTQVVRHYYDNVTNIKEFAMPWIKQGVIMGTSPCRQFWHKEVNRQYFKKRYFVDNKQGLLEPKTKIVEDDVVHYDAPYFRSEDIFQTMIYPHTAQSPREIQRVFWRTKTTLDELKKKADEGTCFGLKGFKDHGKEIDWSFEESQERLSQYGESGLFKAKPKDGYFTLLEVWMNLHLPGTDAPVPVVVEIINETFVTRIQRNPYWHQRPPFDFMRFIVPPTGEFYGRGLPEASIKVQHQLNDTLNQGMDSATLRLNNITIINPAYAPHDESFEIEPGAKWWADPQAVKQFEFPDLTDTAIKNAGVLRGWITEMSDNQPQLPDPIAGKARSTGQAQLAINEWQTDLFTIVDIISNEALAPVAKKTHSLLQQFVPDDDIIRIKGKYAGTWINRVVTPDQIVGNYDFKWECALQIENQAIKTQQMLNFLRVVPSLPEEIRNQFKLHWSNLIKIILRDGFLIRQIENIVETKDMNRSTAPLLENRILELGGVIEVVETDEDQKHIAAHGEALKGLKDAYHRAKMMEHIKEHEKQMDFKIQQAKRIAHEIQMMEMQKQMQGMQGAMKAQQQQQQRQGQGQGGGNPGMIPDSADQSNLERGMKL